MGFLELKFEFPACAERFIVAVVAVALAWTGSATGWAQGTIKIGEELPYRAATPADYPVGGPDRPVAWSETIVSPGATFLRVHFSGFDLRFDSSISPRAEGPLH